MARIIFGWELFAYNFGSRGLYTDKSTAERNSKGLGLGFGFEDGAVIARKMIELDGRVYAIDDKYRDGIPVAELNRDTFAEARDIVSAAKAKLHAALSPDELKALGLDR